MKMPQRAQTAAPADGFVVLDDRLIEEVGGVVVVATAARHTHGGTFEALAAHVARRARAQGRAVHVVLDAPGACAWHALAARLGVGALACDPSAAAAMLCSALDERAVVVAPLSSPGTHAWAVAAELAEQTRDRSSAPLVVLCESVDAAVSDASAWGFGLAGAFGANRCDRVEIDSNLERPARERWAAAIGAEAARHTEGQPLGKLEAWWGRSVRARAAAAEAPIALSQRARALLGALALAERAVPRASIDDVTALDELRANGAVLVDDNWVAPSAACAEIARASTSELDADARERVATALETRFGDDPWAWQRAAELCIDAGLVDRGDRSHAQAVTRAGDPLLRRELLRRWMDRLALLPRDDRARLSVRAAERALGLGEADEAHRWAQAALALVPGESAVALLHARSAVALGDLVTARVSLERIGGSVDEEQRSVVSAELAEVAYLLGDLDGAVTHARAALGLDTNATARLKARNTLGKVLLAQARWDEADAHFVEDSLLAAAADDRTADLRARLNRGIALLSKGRAAEARVAFEAVLAEGERFGDLRACAFALDNLAIVALWDHDYGRALVLSERTLTLRQRLGDRLTMARILANLAELRRKLGLFEHAEHAVAFGRRMLGPGMPAEWSSHFAVVAARLALERGASAEAQREIGRAIADGEVAQNRTYLGEAYRVATRIALDDGNVARARELLGRARALAATDEARAESALLVALVERAAGALTSEVATEALGLAREASEEAMLRECHLLVAEVHRTSGNLDAATGHVAQAASIRDQVLSGLTEHGRTAYLGRTDVKRIGQLQASLQEQLLEAAPASDPAPSSQPVARPTAKAPRELIGDDPAIRGLRAAIKRVARSTSTVLVRGESGTGKELVAEAIHRASDRAQGPLVTVNCAALVESLLLSELFGHERGAFTGAVARRRGRFELAEGGTLFLDEIGDISPRTQVALLRVLQERTFERVGGTAPIHADVRIVCATNRDLRAMVERGEFREDLYYRLRGISLEVPPLRAHLGDLPRIAEHLLARIAAERAEPIKRLSSDALDLLGRYRWPGNVRELENALRVATLFAETETVDSSDLSANVDDLRAGAPSSLRPQRPERSQSVVLRAVPACDAEGDHVDADAASEPSDASLLPAGESVATAAAYTQVRMGTSLLDMKRQIERDCVARALAETRGNITRAAALLGMKRPRLSQLVKQYGLLAVSSEGS